MRKELIIIAGLVLLAGTGLAQPADMKPGITPDSPFYFMDRAFDRFQSGEKVADEKAAEMMVMAEENKTRAMEKAEKSYTNAMERRLQNAQGNANNSENMVQQASKHMEMFSARTNLSDPDSRRGMNYAVNRSAQEMGKAFQELNKTAPRRANRVAEQTLQRVMKNAPEHAMKGLQNALNAVKGQVPVRGRMDEITGRPESAGPENSNGNSETGQEERPPAGRNDSTVEDPDSPVSSNVSDEEETNNETVEEPGSENVSGRGM